MKDFNLEHVSFSIIFLTVLVNSLTTVGYLLGVILGYGYLFWSVSLLLLNWS